MQRNRIHVSAAWLLLFVTPIASRAAEVLNNVPDDALGFVLARNLIAVDRKTQQLVGNMQIMAVSPLTYLHEVLGLREARTSNGKPAKWAAESLDTKGDVLLVVLPPQADGDWPQIGVWLPVSNYDQFVSALGGSATQKITAVTVAGEDLLVARQEKWALVMDPDQRQRMEDMLDSAAARQQSSTWMDWVDTQDVTVVALSDGVRDFLKWATESDATEAADQAVEEINEEDIFDLAPQQPSRGQIALPIPTKIQLALRQWLSRSPNALKWAHDTEAIGVGLRLDDEGNALVGIRATMKANSEFVAAMNRDVLQGDALPALYQGGEFVVAADGALPRAVTSAVASAYVRSIIDEMKTQEQLDIDEATLARFYQEVEQAADMLESIAVFAEPGDDEDGVYTNNFAAVRVTSAEAFVDHAGEVMRLWNQMNREARRGTQLIFDVKDVPIGERAAREYSIDIAAADGGPALPEIRQAMEKLFGPGGKLRFFIVPVDDQTVLLAAATPEQIASILQALDVNLPNDWNGDPLGVANRMLPREADWRVFFSPNGYTKWHARKMNAITGPVFGGPIVKEFPASPPIGAAGGLNERGFWADFAVPAQTIHALGTYRQPKGIRIQR
ncbi:MAG TPA: hypothetical protein VJ828_02475 [Lacipirellulaceae bacterium]|nr:hypothetical protein [Lacipirellulaceae bacterium]